MKGTPLLNEISAPYEVPQFPIEEIERKLAIQRQLSLRSVPPPSVAPTTRPWRSHVGHVAVKGSHSSIPANFADYRPNFQCDSVGTESLVEPSGAPWRTNHRPPFSHPTQSMNRESIPELLFLPDILPRIHSHNTPRGFLNSLPPLTFLNLSDIPFNIFQRFPYRHRRRCLLFEFLLFFLYVFMYLFIIS